MFESFYQFNRTPFVRDIKSTELFTSPQINEVLGRLNYTIERQLFTVVSGNSGVGKTTTIRKFKDSIDRSKYCVMYLADSKLTPRNFYKELLQQLGCEAKFYRGDAKRQLHKQIEHMKELHHQTPVVIVDEAHLLDKEMLEEVRFLLNFQMDSQSPMSLILVGQTELWEKLHLQYYAAIKQRIDIQCKILPYDRATVGDYVRHHLRYAGCTEEIFTESALDEIYKFSNGIYRLINKVCTNCLIYGAQSKRRLIDDHMVKEIIASEIN